jgi:hypothetical protein
LVVPSGHGLQSGSLPVALKKPGEHSWEYVGRAVNCTVGRRVGYTVGIAVGLFDLVGRLVSSTVGASVGSALGIADGPVGSAVGRREGLAVWMESQGQHFILPIPVVVKPSSHRMQGMLPEGE